MEQKLCGKMVKSGTMIEARPCIRTIHGGYCTPDLTGLVFTHLTVLRRGPDFKTRKGELKTSWIVRERNNEEKLVPARNLLSGNTKGDRVTCNLTGSCVLDDGRSKPEYATWVGHRKAILKSTARKHRTYKGMPFYPDWMESYLHFERWLQSPEGIGMRPSPEHSLHIIKHETGFWPGNLAWVLRKVQSAEQMFKIIGRLEHENKQLKKRLSQYEKV